MLRLRTVAALAGLGLLCSAAPGADMHAVMPGGYVLADGSTWTTEVAFLRQTLDAHSAAATALAVTPDGSTLFTGGHDGHVKIWDLATGELLQDVPACQARINDIAISPDNTYMVTAAEDGYVKVWDVVTAELLVALPAHLGGPESQGAVGRYNQTVRSAEGTAPRYAAERVPAVISANSVAIAPDSLYFYTAGDDGYIRKYNVEQNYALTYAVYSSNFGVNDIVLNSTGAYLFAGGGDGFMNIFNAELGVLESRILAYEQGQVSALALNWAENCIATGSTGGEVRVWDAATGTLVKKIKAHAGDVNWVSWLSDDSWLLSGGQDGQLRVWNHSADKLGELKTHVLSFNEAVLVDCTIVTAGDDYKVRLWDANFPGCQMVEAPPVIQEPPYIPPMIEQPQPPQEPQRVEGRG